MQKTKKQKQIKTKLKANRMSMRRSSKFVLLLLLLLLSFFFLMKRETEIHLGKHFLSCFVGIKVLGHTL